METEINIIYKNNYLEVKYEGQIDYEFAHRLWTKIVSECKKYNCYKILGIARSQAPLSVSDGYKHAELFKELGIDHNYKIAWVELESKAFDSIQFTETVLFNRGFPGNLYTNVEDAKTWLLSD